MPCSICRQTGHNRATCPQRDRSQDRVRARRPIRRERISTQVQNESDLRSQLVLNKWRKSFRKIRCLRRMIRIIQNSDVIQRDNNQDETVKEIYFAWTKIKKILSIIQSEFIARIIGIDNLGGLRFLGVVKDYNIQCIHYHQQNHSEQNHSVKNKNRKITIHNMRNENYLVYWVVGNYFIEDFDSKENFINYISLLSKNDKLKIKTQDGHRFYIIPHRLDIVPQYHPETDRQFLIEPYCVLNIHDGIQDKIFIDDKESLSELNRWKFNALKLDYLIREVVRFGGKNNDTLSAILDLHEDIQLDEVSETEKDIAGVPSKMTNIT